MNEFNKHMAELKDRVSKEELVAAAKVNPKARHSRKGKVA